MNTEHITTVDEFCKNFVKDKIVYEFLQIRFDGAGVIKFKVSDDKIIVEEIFSDHSDLVIPVDLTGLEKFLCIQTLS